MEIEEMGGWLFDGDGNLVVSDQISHDRLDILIN